MNYKLIITLAFLFSSHLVCGQKYLIPLRSMDTLYVSDIKTTHLLLEEDIEYVDIGSPYFVADTLQQMIRIKHTGEELTDIKSQLSNLTIITNSGSYYSIFLGYDRFATRLNYKVIKSDQIVQVFKKKEEAEIEKAETLASLCNLIEKSDSNIHIVNRWDNDLEVQITGIFYVKEKIGIRLEIRNKSTMDFDIDHILFRAKLRKRFSADYLYQERVISPVKMCTDDFEVIGNGLSVITVLFDKFMLNEKERLYIDIFEQNGGRSTTIRIPRKKLLQPKVL